MTIGDQNLLMDIARRGHAISKEIERATARARAMLALEHAGIPEGFWR
jgi:hypothetical protein